MMVLITYEVAFNQAVYLRELEYSNHEWTRAYAMRLKWKAARLSAARSC